MTTKPFIIPHQPDLSLTDRAGEEWSEAIPGIVRGESFQYKTWEDNRGITYLYKRINNVNYFGGYRIFRTYFGSNVARYWLADIIQETGRKIVGWNFE